MLQPSAWSPVIARRGPRPRRPIVVVRSAFAVLSVRQHDCTSASSSASSSSPSFSRLQRRPLQRLLQGFSVHVISVLFFSVLFIFFSVLVSVRCAAAAPRKRRFAALSTARHKTPKQRQSDDVIRPLTEAAAAAAGSEAEDGSGRRQGGQAEPVAEAETPEDGSGRRQGGQAEDGS